MSTYVYGITKASHPFTPSNHTGVGEPPAPLRTVRTESLAAVVSDAPENLQGKRRDLEAHESVLEDLMSEGAVLPMRFGMAAPDDSAVEQELTVRAQPYADLLGALDGHVEINIKATHREEALLRELLTGNAGLRKANEALREAGGGDHQQRLEFGERVSAAIEERRTTDAEQLLAILRPFASRESVGAPVGESFANISLLVDEQNQAELAQTIERLRQEIGWLMELNVYGPLPPYSFVDVGPGQE